VSGYPSRDVLIGDVVYVLHICGAWIRHLKLHAIVALKSFLHVYLSIVLSESESKIRRVSENSPVDLSIIFKFLLYFLCTGYGIAFG
jgi:hypothetical protein